MSGLKNYFTILCLAANSSEFQVSSIVTEKNGSVNIRSSDESSNSSSRLRGKSNKLNREVVNKRGSETSSDVSSSMALKSSQRKVEESSNAKSGMIKIQSNDKGSNSSSASEPKGRHDTVDWTINSSLAKVTPQSLTDSLNNMALDDRSASSSNVNFQKANAKVQYKHEKWMLPDQAQDTLIQLNLAIVSFLVVVL